MYIKPLQAFLAVARLLNFGDAARDLNYSQSTISEQIRSLEEYLGAKLFERIGKKVFLTEEGRRLLPLAERMVGDAEAMKGLFASGETVTGSLTIGAAESLCAFWLPPLLRDYRARHPGVQVVIKVGRCPEFPPWLQQNLIDVAFTLSNEAEAKQLRQIDLFTGETVFTVAPDHELAAKPALTPQDLAGQTFILPEAEAAYRVDLENLLASEAIKVNTIMEFGSLEAIKQCVRSGLGVSLLPRMAVAGELGRGELAALPWRGRAIPIRARMIFHRDKWLAPPLAALLKLISPAG